MQFLFNVQRVGGVYSLLALHKSISLGLNVAFSSRVEKDLKIKMMNSDAVRVL